MEVDINAWVNEAAPERVSFRQAVHMVLHAVASSEYLKTSMVMKGGMLLGIRYHSSRFTEDIDFSSKVNISDVKEDEFIGSMNDALALA
ncbi:nucleotidyl transferase AbiEii/AbiGii toxin family protein, partial [Aeromonas veronii]